MVLTILIAMQKCHTLGKLKLKSRRVENGEDVTRPNHGSISPVAASQLVPRAASDNAIAQTRNGLVTRGYLPSPSPCSAIS